MPEIIQLLEQNGTVLPARVFYRNKNEVIDSHAHVYVYAVVPQPWFIGQKFRNCEIIVLRLCIDALYQHKTMLIHTLVALFFARSML